MLTLSMSAFGGKADIARPLGYHQDSAYHPWLAPQAMLSCWIALDDTTAEGGTMELVRGSHQWMT